MLRSVLAVVAGVVVGSVLVFAVETVGHLLWPSRIAIDAADPEQMRRLVAATPLGAKIAVVLSWFAGALGGGVLAVLLARRWAPVAWIVAATIFCLAAANFVAVPHPLWMQAGAVVASLAAGFLAVRMTRAQYVPPPPAPRRPFA